MTTDSTTALAQACLLDLEAIPAFLRENDAGAQQPVTPDDEAKRQAAFESARLQAATVRDDVQCDAILQAYLRSWRKGHLFVQPVKTDGPSVMSRTLSEAPLPGIEMLSAATALITLPNFHPTARQPLETLLERHRKELESHPNWVIDVRSNDGGTDAAYAPLLPWLMPDGWLEVSVRVLVTPANVHAEEHVCEEFLPGDADCARITAETVQRMRSVGNGQWVQQEYQEGWRSMRANIENHRPQRVAVLMDGGCVSSCEQFLLTVRQSFSVKLVGHRRSHGALDASNLRPHLLPSGRRRLWYATTLSNRLPRLPVDGIGICPDVFLPWPEDESDRSLDVKRTQRWLEHLGW